MFELNGENTEGLGFYFKRGSLNRELLKLPKPKPRYTYDWKDQNGLERDTITPITYEAIQYTINCYLAATDLTDLLDKRNAVISLLSNPAGFVLKSNTLGRSYKMYYIDSTLFNTLTPINANSKLYCEFALTLENDYEATLNEFYLADDNALIVTEDEDYIVVEGFEVNY